MDIMQHAEQKLELWYAVRDVSVQRAPCKMELDVYLLNNAHAKSTARSMLTAVNGSPTTAHSAAALVDQLHVKRHASLHVLLTSIWLTRLLNAANAENWLHQLQL